MRPFQKKKQHSPGILVFGIRAVAEAITSGKEIDRLFIQQGIKSELFAELRQLLVKHNIPYQHVPLEKITRLVGDKNHQGVVATISEITFYQIEELLPAIFEKGETPFLLILDRITDVRNFGAICRTAECAGVHAIIIPSRGGAQVNADAVKTSAGALHKMPVCRENNLKETIDFLKDSGLRIIACTEKCDDFYFETDLQGPLAVIMGSEEDGISEEYLKRCDARAKIPLAGTIGSLNVSVAAGVLMYEVVRQNTVGK